MNLECVFAIVCVASGLQVPDGEELNQALQDEVLYFTLLGLRAAAAGEHLWWKNNAHGDAGVDLVSAIRSGKSTATVHRDCDSSEMNHIHFLTNGVVQSFAHIGLLLLPRPQHHAAWQLQRGGGRHASGTCKNWSSHDRGRS